MLRRLLLMWAANVAALFVAASVVDKIDYDDWWALILAGLVFGIVNSLVRPVVRLLLKTVGLPLVILTFGVVLFFVNVLMLYLTHWIVSGFEIQSFGAAIAGAAIIWVVQFVLEAAFGLGRGRDRKR
jgi:putative membrane protein